MLAMLTATLVMRYGVIDLVSSVRGTTSPPAVARQRRMELAHERAMAKIAHRTGPTVGEAVAARIAARVGQPKAPKVRKDRGAFRSYLSGLWGDSWEHATTSRVRHHERKVVGDLPRQRAARAVRDAARRRVEAARAARQAVDEPEPAADADEPLIETMPPADETMPIADLDTATRARARGCCYYAGDGSTDESCASPVTTLIRLEGDPWRIEVCDEHRDRWHTAHDPDETGRYAVPVEADQSPRPGRVGALRCIWVFDSGVRCTDPAARLCRDMHGHDTYGYCTSHAHMAAASFGDEIQWHVPGVTPCTEPICPVCGQPGLDHPECVALTYGDDDDAAPTGPPPGGPTTPEPPSAAPTTAITDGGTMNVTGETLDPQAGLDFTQAVQSAMADWVARIEQSVANLTQRGVSGGPIDVLNGISDALASVVGKADEGVGYFESHLQIQDVAQADETVGGEEYLGVGAARH